VCTVFLLRISPVMCSVFVGFGVTCEVRCLLWKGVFCGVCGVIVCVLCVVLHVYVLCCGVFFAVKSVICWLIVRGGVYVVVCVFPVCCVLSVL